MPNTTKLLLVEDETSLALIIKQTLEDEGFVVDTAIDGKEGLDHFFSSKPDIVVADVMMPRMDGFEMVRRIRQADPHTPVLMLTARTAIGDVVEGFETGANDYLRKPFGIQELIIRIKALLGRAVKPGTPAITHGDWIEIGSLLLNPRQQILRHNGVTISLSHREAEVLRRLATTPNQIVSLHDLLVDLWGDDNFFNSRSLQVFITRLRKKLQCDPSVRIVNVRAAGYKLIL